MASPSSTSRRSEVKLCSCGTLASVIRVSARFSSCNVTSGLRRSTSASSIAVPDKSMATSAPSLEFTIADNNSWRAGRDPAKRAPGDLKRLIGEFADRLDGTRPAPFSSRRISTRPPASKTARAKA